MEVGPVTQDEALEVIRATSASIAEHQAAVDDLLAERRRAYHAGRAAGCTVTAMAKAGGVTPAAVHAQLARS